MTDVTTLTNMVYVKPPKYTGRRADWLDWQARMFCCLAQNGCGEALIERTVPIQVMTMTERGSFDRTDANEMARYRYTLIQDKACGILQNSIRNDTEREKYAFGLFKSTQSTDLPAGDFALAWKKLKAHHDGLEEGKVIDYEKQYHTYKFKDDFRPDHAIMKLDVLRKQVNEHVPDRAISDAQFIKHVLGRLPTGEDNEVGPYQAKRTIIKDHMDGNNNYGISDLLKDLMNTWHALHANDEESDDETDSDDEIEPRRKTKSETALVACTRQQPKNNKNNRSNKNETGLAAYSRQPKKKCVSVVDGDI